MEKTNVMRLLDAAGVSYVAHEYDAETTDGKEVARLVNKPCDCVFKTLVTVSGKNVHYVFVIPVNATLDLKKAAKAVNEKSIEMLKQKDLLSLTGYVHGGCSPLGMKKSFKTVIDETAILCDSVCVSAGRKGKQIELAPSDLKNLSNAEFRDII